MLHPRFAQLRHVYSTRAHPNRAHPNRAQPRLRYLRLAHLRLAVAAAIGAVLVAPVTTGHAQQAPASNPDYFIPGQSRPAAPAHPAARPAGAAGAAAPVPATPDAEATPSDADTTAGATPQQVQVALPPPPVVLPLPKTSPPPAAIMGIISVPDVMHGSTAYQAVDKQLAARRQKLNEDAQKEQTTLRDLGQALTNDRGKMTAEQIRAKERELQDRVAESRRKFAERNRIIQEAGQRAGADRADAARRGAAGGDRARDELRAARPAERALSAGVRHHPAGDRGAQQGAALGEHPARRGFGARPEATGRRACNSVRGVGDPGQGNAGKEAMNG